MHFLEATNFPLPKFQASLGHISSNKHVVHVASRHCGTIAPCCTTCIAAHQWWMYRTMVIINIDCERSTSPSIRGLLAISTQPYILSNSHGLINSNIHLEISLILTLTS